MPQITDWLMNIGVSEQLILILAFVPILVTLTSISRYILGIKTFGIYAPMILAFAFFFSGIIGSLTVAIVVVISSYLTRNLLKRTQMHYMSRIAFIYGGVAIMLGIFLALVSYSGWTWLRVRVLNIEPLSFLAIITIIDRLVANYIKKGITTAIRLTSETMIVALIGWSTLYFDPVRTFVIDNLWLIPLTLLLNFLIGGYSGFRLSEYLRFHQIVGTRNERKQTE